MRKTITLFFLLIIFCVYGKSEIIGLEPGSPEYDALKMSGQISQPIDTPYTGDYPDVQSINREGFLIPLDETFSVALGANDDGSTGAINFPFVFDFYGDTYTHFYINNNGNVSFNNSYSTYSPYGFPVSGYPMLAPFWGDVDTRGAGSGVVYYRIEPNRVTIIWDGVGYYSHHYDKVNYFELIITDGSDPLIGIGNNVAFSYGDMQWTTGDASGGSGGFGGTAATVGINKGDGESFALLGRFDHAGEDYDGPGNNPDGVSYLDDQLFSFSTTDIDDNVPPVATGFPSEPVMLYVGESIDLTIQFLSPEEGQTTTTELEYIDFAGFSYDITNGNVSTIEVNITGEMEDVGEHVIEFVATDDGIPNQMTIIYLEVEILNHPPYLEQLIPDIYIDEDTAFQINLGDYFNDQDIQYGDILTYNYNLQNWQSMVTINGDIANIEPFENWNGNNTIIFHAFDIYSGTICDTVEIIVAPINDPPTINLPDLFRFRMNQFTIEDFQDYTEDVDGDNLTLSVQGNVNISIEIADLQVTMSASDDWTGSEEVIFTVSDSVNRVEAFDTVEINVYNPASASFTAEITEGVAPLEVQFNNSSTGDVIEYNWDFDYDGIVDSYEENPVWVYEEAGTYSVELQAIDVQSASSMLRNNYIVVIEAAEIEVLPVEINETLTSGESSIQTMTLNNTGGSDLNWHLRFNNDIPVRADNQPVQAEEERVFAKDEEDNRTGTPVTRGWGGPDYYGHIWKDSDEVDGPEYEWFDISELGTNTGLSGDDSYVYITFPFEFNFYGEIKTTAIVTTNGYITFGTNGTNYHNHLIPSSTTPDDLIAPFWDDLRGGTNYSYFDSERNRFIIQFTNCGRCYGAGSYTFQVQFYESGTIIFQYQTMTGILNSATIGIENSDVTDFLSIAYNTEYIHSEMAIKIQNSPDWVYADHYTGTIPAGESDDIALLFDSLDYNSGQFQADMIISSNDPVEPEVIVPVTLNIAGLLEADFSCDTTAGIAPLEVHFEDQSVGSIVTWEWDFNHDGIIDSYEQNPVWVYEEAGIYSVSLTVIDAEGRASDVEFKEDYITVDGYLLFDPVILDFGDVLINSSVTQNLTIFNNTLSNAYIDSIYADFPFIVDSYTGQEIPAGNSFDIQVSFAPSATVFYEEELIIATNIGEYFVTLQGTGEPPTPNWQFSWFEHDFGQVDIETGAQTSIMITNTGNMDLIISDCEVSEEHFEVTETSFMLDVGESVEIFIDFSPEDILQYNAVISYTCEAGTQEFNVYGNGYWLSEAPILEYSQVEGYDGNYGIYPQSGSSQTYFEYRVIYSDADNNAPMPGFPQVGIDQNGDEDFLDPGEVCFPMTAIDSDDDNYADGKEYSYITLLPLDMDLGYKFLAYDVLGNIAVGEGTNYEEDPLVSDDLLDLSIYANNITFSDYSPDTGQEITITARVNNNSDYPAENVSVTFYEEDEFIYEGVISYIPAQSQRSITIEHIFIEPEYYPVKVVIDEAALIDEDNELNNFAIRPVTVGDFSIPGAITATSNLNTSTVYPDGTLRFYGSAEYQGTRFREISVCGAQVVVSVSGYGYNASYTGYTDSSGNYSIYFDAPYSLGEYSVIAEITDFTLTAQTNSHNFEVIYPESNSYPSPEEELPDLTFSSFSLSGEPVVGNIMTISGCVTNSGFISANDVLVYIYIDNILADSLMFEQMYAGQNECFSMNTTFFVHGGHSVRAVVDPYNTILEEIEYNNSASTGRYIYPTEPDLTPCSILCSDYSPLAGHEIDMTFIIENLNYVSSDATNADIYYISSGTRTETLIGRYNLQAVNGLSSEMIIVNDYVFYEPGIYQIKIDVDPENYVNESSENNQILYRTLTVQEPTAELTISAINVSSSTPAMGDMINFSATISNPGSSEASNFEVAFYCDDIIIGETILIESLTPGDNQIIVSNQWETDDFPHQISAVIDVFESVPELNEYNNSTQRAIGVDFRASRRYFYTGNSSYNRINVLAGVPFNVNCRIYNDGTFRGEEVSVTYFLEADVYGNDIIPSINPGTFMVTSTGLTFDEPGNFTLRIYADRNPDGSEDFNEISENNNFVDIYIHVYEESPDLEILSEYIAPEELNPDPNEEIAIYASIFNNGNVAADSFLVNILVDNEILDGQILVPGIPAHEDVTIESAVLYSSPLIGPHIISVEVDCNDDVTEYDEMNNIATRAVIVGDAPDFRFISDISFSNSNPSIGELISISANVKNSGGADAGAEVYWWCVTGEDSTLIDIVDFELAAQDTTIISIFWYASSPYGEIFAEIINSNPSEFNTLNNHTVNDFGQGIIQIATIEDILLNEDEPAMILADLDDLFQNVDDTPLSYTISTPEGVMQEIDAENQLSIALQENWFGEGVIIITAENIYGDMLNIEVNILVNPINDLPEFNLPASLTFRADSTLTVDFSEYLTDVDNDEIWLGCIPASDLNVEIDGLMVTFVSIDFWHGSEEVTFIADDSQSRAVSEASIEIIVTPVPFGADFIADVTSGAAPLEVHFNNLSSPNAIYFAWDFQNDGEIDSFEENPVWIYEEPGLYSVSLTVNDEVSRSSDTMIKENYIEVVELINYGDIDDNGDVESYDVSLILMNLVNMDPLPEDPVPWEDWRFQRGDVDLDGELHAIDGAYILQYVIGIREFLPVYDPYRSTSNAEILTDHQYLYLNITENVLSIEYEITSSINMEMGKPSILLENCLYIENGNSLALSSASPICGTIVKIPYERNTGNCSELSMLIVIDGNMKQVDFDLAAELPEVTLVESIYPNPFNPETTIKYELAENGRVVIDVFNIKGQNVAEISDEYKEAGKYSVVWKADEYNSGIYFIRFTSRENTFISKVILLK